MIALSFIPVGIAADHRGSIRFANAFDMADVKRFYIIENKDTDTIRGWRGHRAGQRWYYVLDGAFSLNVVQIDHWEQPSRELPITGNILQSADQRVIHVPAGYAIALQALQPGSRLLAFADQTIEQAEQDNHVFPADYFVHVAPDMDNENPAFMQVAVGG